MSKQNNHDIMTDCVFCKIIRGDIPTDMHYVSDRVVAFSDINPIAPVHILIIPVTHIASMNDITDDDAETIAELFFVAKKIAKEHGIAESGYKLLIRTGRDGGQEVPHVHLHIIGGAPLAEGICPCKSDDVE